MARTVVQLLELVEVAEHERERMAVAERAGGLDVELAHERTTVREPRERVVVGQELHFLEAGGGLERRGRLVGEQPERLHLLALGHEPVARVVRPDESLQRAVSILQRHDQPVSVPRVRPVAVQYGRVADVRHPRPHDVERQEVTPLHLVLGVEERHQRRGRQSRRRRSGRAPARRRAWREPAAVRLGELDRDTLETEGAADAVGHALEDVVHLRGLTQARRDLEEVLQRRGVARGRLVRFRVLDRERDVLRDSDQNIELVDVRPAERRRLVDGHHAEQRTGRRPQRHEQHVLGMPRVGIVGRRLDRRSERRARCAPVVRARGDHVCAAPEEALVEERPVVGMRAGKAAQRLARLFAAAHGRDAKVIPRGPVERDRHGLVTERVADRRCELVQPLGQAPTRACESSHLDQPPERARGVALRHSYANFHFITESYRRIRSGS